MLDATSGRNAIAQAKTFLEVTGVTGLALTKLDGTAKGGVVLSVTREVGAPIRFIGVGGEGGRPPPLRRPELRGGPLLKPAFR